MVRLKLIYFLVAFVILADIQGQTVLKGIVNQYVEVTQVFDNDYADSIVVADASAFAIGDKVMIYQMKGAELYPNDVAVQKLQYAGKYEILVIGNINYSSNTIYFTANFFDDVPKTYTFDPSESLQLIKIPAAEKLLIDSAVTCKPWDGKTGGVVVMIASNRIILNADIDVSGKGLRGATEDSVYAGSCSSLASNDYDEFHFSENASDTSGRKGESIVSTSFTYTRGLGRVVNGGGSGSGKLAGGYGGGNGGAGGRGGNEFSSCVTNYSKPAGGRITPGSYSKNVKDNNSLRYRTFMGGGGGGSTQLAPSSAGNGGNGGGIILLIADTIVGNQHKLIANGGNAANAANANGGAGGGGGGGTVMLAAETIVDSLIIQANGGKGGSTSGNPCPGNGGGGGGGILWYAENVFPQGIATFSISGGANGSNPVCGSMDASFGSDGETVDSLNVPLNGFLFNYIYGSHDNCEDVLPRQLTGSQPKGGNGLYFYLWQSKTNTSSWDTATAGTFNQKHFVFTQTIQDTTWFRRIVKSYRNSDTTFFVDSLAIVDTSAFVKVNILPYIQNNLIDSSQLICEGLAPDTLRGTPKSSLSGGINAYTFIWEKSRYMDVWDTAGFVFYNKDYYPGVLVDTTYFRRKVLSHVCVSYDTVIIKVLPKIENNIILSDHWVCSGAAPDSLNGSVPVGGDDLYRYRWQQKGQLSNWVDALGVNNLVAYAPQHIADTMFFRRIVHSGAYNNCKDTTATWEVNLLDTIAGNIISLDTAIVCLNTLTGKPIEGSLSTGAAGSSSYRYQWLYSIDSSSWTLLADTLQSLLPDTIVAQSYFRRIVQSIACLDTSKPVKVMAYPLPFGEIFSLDTSLCSGKELSIRTRVKNLHGPWKIVLSDGINEYTSFQQLTDSFFTVNPATSDSAMRYNYRLIALTDARTCQAPADSLIGEVKANAYGWPVADAARDTQVCGNTYLLEALSGFGDGYWSELNYPASVTFSDKESNLVTVSVSLNDYTTYAFTWELNNHGCKSSDTVLVEFYSLPLPFAGEDMELNFTTKTTLSASPLGKYETGLWSLLSGTATFEEPDSSACNVYDLSDQTTNALLWTVNRGLCSPVSDTLMVLVNELFIPGGFSPNGDGINDYLSMDGLDDSKIADLTILNRWGNVLYRDEDFKNNWDGKNNQGLPLPDGTYFYILTVKGELERELKGFIVIKR